MGWPELAVLLVRSKDGFSKWDASAGRNRWPPWHSRNRHMEERINGWWRGNLLGYR